MIIDGGAAEGSFTQFIKGIYPEAKVIAIEPRPETQAKLTQVAAELSGVTIVPKLIGAQAGEVEFHVDQDRSSLLGDATGRAFGTTQKFAMTTLDLLMDEPGSSPPI